MGQYIKIEIKRLFHTLPGFFPAVSGVLLLGVFFLLLAGHFLPEVLEVKPFRVGFCAEGGDMMSEYVREYVQQMESTEGLIEFCEMQSREIEAALREGELAAGIMIPERTAESIMDGTNIPIRVLLSGGTDTPERYLQSELLLVLTECGAALIDVPQAETLLLYELQAENPEELGTVLDLFHMGLVLERENWFEKETVSAFGSIDTETYYMAAGMTLLFLFWGLGSGSFFREQEKNLPLLLERQGIPLFFQQGVRQVLFIGLYLIPVPILYLAANAGGAGMAVSPAAADPGKTAVALVLCGAMLAMQCGFFFQLAPTTGSGIFLNGIWGLIGFFGAGGVLPTVFLPRNLAGVCSAFPAGICMEFFRQIISEKRGAEVQVIKCGILWCLFFGAGGQLLFYGRQWSKKRK